MRARGRAVIMATSRGRILLAAALLHTVSPVPRVLAASCCAGTFVSEGRGGTYPPGPEGRAFNFIASNDNATRRFAQRSSVRSQYRSQ